MELCDNRISDDERTLQVVLLQVITQFIAGANAKADSGREIVLNDGFKIHFVYIVRYVVSVVVLCVLRLPEKGLQGTQRKHEEHNEKFICGLAALNDFKVAFILPIGYRFQMLFPLPLSCLHKMLNERLTQNFFCNI